MKRIAVLGLLIPATLAYGGSWSVIFTEGDGSFSFNAPMNQQASALISSATTSVDVAVYNLTDAGAGSVTEALIERHITLGAGAVRIITDTDGMGNSAVQDLIAAGITVIDDNGVSDEMHNKFIVVDSQRVWTGSANFTDPGFSSQDNAAILIDDVDVAAAFAEEFTEMWTGTFKTSSPPSVQTNWTLDGRPLRVFFSPEDDPIDDQTIGLRSYVASASESVHFAAYVFTGDLNDPWSDLCDDLDLAHGSGLVVRGVLDDWIHADQPPYADDGFSGSQLDEVGVDVRLDGNSDMMHAKLAVIDQDVLVMGSANFTYSADAYNDENMIFLEDPGAARRATLWINALHALAADTGTPASPAADSSPPTSVTAVVLSDGAGAGAAQVSWDASAAADLSRYHVFLHDAPIDAPLIDYRAGALDPAATVKVGTSAALTQLSDGRPVVDGVDLYVAVVATDTSGNESGLGGGSTAGPVQMVAGLIPDLLPPSPGMAGVFNTFTANNLQPGVDTKLVMGTSAGQIAVPGCPVLTVGLASPRVISSTVADGSGTANFGINVPAGAAGSTVRFVAVQLPGCVASDVELYSFP
ncbi:MAG: hypothetical protein GWP91_01065 [Rhodobacterales bacterium]|nr:hypothetical protein [Rhodobacterales bacterium]